MSKKRSGRRTNGDRNSNVPDSDKRPIKTRIRQKPGGKRN